MRRAVVLAGTVLLLVGPTVLAFFAGGYFDGPRVVAAGIAWALVLVLALAGPLPLPTSRAGRVALAGLAGLAAWSAISYAWAPLVSPVIDSVQRLLLYLAAMLIAVALLRDRRAVRATEPLLALGAFAAIGYGLIGRLLPGIVDLIPARSFVAGGRLEQPITYWNAEGLLAAMGFVLCARLAGDESRPAALRTAAAAACPVLGMGVYLSYSRAALAAAAFGIVVLLALAPTWPQLRAAGVGVLTSAAAAASAAGFPGVASLSGTIGQRESDGAIMLGILAVIVVGAALLAAQAVRAEGRGTARIGVLPEAGRLRALAWVAAVFCVVGLVAGSISEKDHGRQTPRAAPSRLTSLTSLRYEYWRVGFRGFREEPVRGLGAGGFRAFWRVHRPVDAGANEVHSLPLEIAAELGLVGLVFLGLLFGGVVAAGRQALARGAPLAPGACAVCIVWLMHAAIDWDWQVPAVTLPAIVLAGGLLAASERVPPRPAPRRPAVERDRPRRPLTVTTG
jgi:hypothetical protein